MQWLVRDKKMMRGRDAGTALWRGATLLVALVALLPEVRAGLKPGRVRESKGIVYQLTDDNFTEVYLPKASR